MYLLNNWIKLKRYWANFGPNKVTPPKPPSREWAGSLGGGRSWPLSQTLGRWRLGGGARGGAKGSLPCLYKPPPPLSFTPRPQASLPSPSPLQRCSVRLEPASVLEDFGSASTSSAAPLIRRTEGGIFFAASPWSLEVTHVWHLSLGWSTTRPRRQRWLVFINYACMGAKPRVRSSRVWFRTYLCIRIYTSA
jgi:hypothetical protein